MDNQEPQSRVKRYDFNQGSNQPNRPPKNFRVWPWILGLVVVIGCLVGGIKWLTADHNRNQPNQTERAVQSSSTSSHKQTSSKNSTTNSQKTTAASNKNSSHSAASNSASDHSNTNEQSDNNKQPPADHSSANGGSFAAPRQFSSVADATSWAKATQSSWLQAGYNNYQITSDGQGYYVLTFTK